MSAPVQGRVGAAPPEGPRGRIAAIDVARGVALVAMAAYHATWDLGFLQLTPENYALTAPGKAAARVIAASFLTLVGASLVLAHGEGVRWRSFLRRLAQVAGAALAITAATAYAFPASYIFFGILHEIALASVLALPLVNRSWPVAGLAAAAMFALGFADAPALFDAPLLGFVGLGSRVPVTNDYVPLVPWSGFVFAGVALARLGLPWLRARIGAWRPRRLAGRTLAAAGRHSLAIYLVHQPLLLGASYVALLALGPTAGAEAPFRHDIEAQCEGAGGRLDACVAASGCLVSKLRTENLWVATSRGTLTPIERERAIGLLTSCYAEVARGSP